MTDDAEPQPGQLRRLPVWRTVKASYDVTLSNFGTGLRLAVVPLAFAVVPLLLESFAWSGMSLRQGLCGDTYCELHRAVMYGQALLAIILTTPMMVAWHRLCDPEHHSNAGAFNIDRETIKYGGWVLFGILVLVAIAFFPLIMLSFYLHNPNLSDLQFGLVLLITCSLILAIIWRMCLALPGVALGKARPEPLKRTKTKGDVWRLFACVTLATTPPFIAMVFVSGMLGGSYFFFPGAGNLPAFSDQVATTVFNAPLWVILVCVWASVMSFAYRYLVEGEEIVLPGERAA